MNFTTFLVLIILCTSCTTKRHTLESQINSLGDQPIDSLKYSEIVNAAKLESNNFLNPIDVSELDTIGLNKIIEYEKSRLNNWVALPEYKDTHIIQSLVNDSVRIIRCATKDKAPGEALRTPVASVESLTFIFMPSVTTIRIPVRVHIINNSNGFMYENKYNLRRKQLEDQFDVLNRAFNPHRIYFTLASIDSVDNSEWNESGAHYYSPATVERMLDHFAETPESHLNLYIIDGRKTGRIILGEATFPWDIVAGRYDDYIVISYRTLPGFATGPYNQGKTLIHEVGHYLGLWHTFEGRYDCDDAHNDGCYYGDRVDDTPAQKFCHFGSCDCGGILCDTCPEDEGPDPVNNYMGYNSDSCLTQFTNGQILRAFQSVSFHRSNYIVPSY